MYEFWYDYIKQKYETTNLCYMDTDSVISHIITEEFYKDISNDGLVHLPMIRMMKDHFQQVKTKKVIGLFKVELGGRILKVFCALRAKSCAYLMIGYNDDDYDKKKTINKPKE